MAVLAAMPPITIPRSMLAAFGQAWMTNGGSVTRTPPHSSSQLGQVFDQAVGNALATMLGGIPVLSANQNSLLPTAADCVEVGPVRIVGGVRPQNFDVGYRPDGPRFAYDSKTLNDTKSVGKNWQNMVNDLATEATTVHSRFPTALVAFMIVVPEPCLPPGRLCSAITETLERLGRRVRANDPEHTAEAVSFVLWNPQTGEISPHLPEPTSPLRIEQFSAQVEAVYTERYKGLPPHAST